MWKTVIALVLAAFSALAMAAVDVNSASAADLDSIKGIGPGTSSKILAARKASTFKDWNDLIQRVSGIGAARAAKLSANGLRVNGTSYGVAAPARKAATVAPPPAAAAPVETKPAKPAR